MIQQLGIDSAYVLAFIAGVVWLVRLEGKVKANVDATKTLRGWIESLSGKHEKLEHDIKDRLNKIEIILARIDERMSRRDSE